MIAIARRLFLTTPFALLSGEAAAADTKVTVLISVDRFATFLSGLTFHIALKAFTGEALAFSPIPATPADWLSPDAFGRIRLTQVQADLIGFVQVVAHLATGVTYEADCSIGAAAGGVAHVLVEPVILTQHSVKTILDEPNHMVEFRASARALGGIKITSVPAIPGISG